MVCFELEAFRAVLVLCLQNFVLLSALFLVPLARSDDGNKFNDFQLQYDKKADRSSMLYCFVFNGKIANVDPNNEEKGYKCEVNMQTWTKDEVSL